jgi:hypothetical protein
LPRVFIGEGKETRNTSTKRKKSPDSLRLRRGVYAAREHQYRANLKPSTDRNTCPLTRLRPSLGAADRRRQPLL